MQDIKPGANSVHKAPQKSQTLSRKFIKKPVKNSDKQISVNQSVKKTTARSNRAATTKKSASVSRFTKKPLLNKTETIVQPPKSNAAQSVKAPARPTTSSARSAPIASKSAKEKEVERALKFAPVTSSKPKKPKKQSANKKRFYIYGSISVLFIALVGLIIFLIAPNISLQLANNQAGINARYPRQYPEGFSLLGLAEYKNGSVIINFRSKTMNSTFAITQSKTIWDSTKLKSEVKTISSDNFTTTEYKGLTIFHYTLGDEYLTTWINGNILYVISGDTNLDPAQIRATIDGLN